MRSGLVSIVIRCHNEERHIGRLLAGIMQQAAYDPQIIVVDSGSTDATVSIASRYPVQLLTIPREGFSFGRSLNIGCREARGEFIVVASAHVYPLYKDWLAQLLAPFSTTEVALVYGKQRGNESTRYSEHQIFRRWFPDESNLNQGHPFCNNANAAIRQWLWERLPYDETLTGLEDLDWAKRAMQQGHRIAYAADAEVIHVHDETPRRIYNRYRREAIALKHIFPQERFSLPDFVRLFVANALSDSYHAARDRVFWRNLTDIWIFRFMQFLGTFRGNSQRGPVSQQLKQRFYYPNDWRREHREAMDSRPERAIDYAGGSTPERIGNKK
jgi:glycosyltransferase involved in cell wall biosynthesis